VVPYAGADIWRSEVDVAGLAVAVRCRSRRPEACLCANIRRRTSRATSVTLMPNPYDELGRIPL